MNNKKKKGNLVEQHFFSNTKFNILQRMLKKTSLDNIIVIIEIHDDRLNETSAKLNHSKNNYLK